MLKWFTRSNEGKKIKQPGTKSSKTSKEITPGQLTLNDITAQFYFLPGLVASKHDSQDTYGLYNKHLKEFSFYLVLDGHGALGKEASNSVCDFMLAYIDKIAPDLINSKDDNKIISILNKMFEKAEENLRNCGMDMDVSGTTCVCLLIKGTTLFVANVGDSRAVLSRVSETARYAIELTQDHKPTLPEERDRIIKHGGQIKKIEFQGKLCGPYRIWADEHGPGLGSTRSIGDFLGKKIGMLSTPQIQKLNLKEFDQFVVIATDGIWEVLSSSEVVAFILTLGTEREQAARLLVSEAREIWQHLNRCKKTQSRISDLPGAKSSIDDISCIVLFFSYEGIKPYIPAVKRPNFGSGNNLRNLISELTKPTRDGKLASSTTKLESGGDNEGSLRHLKMRPVEPGLFDSIREKEEGTEDPLEDLLSQDPTPEVTLPKKQPGESIQSKRINILPPEIHSQALPSGLKPDQPGLETNKSQALYKVQENQEESSSSSQFNSEDLEMEDNAMFTIVEYQNKVKNAAPARTGMAHWQSQDPKKS